MQDKKWHQDLFGGGGLLVKVKNGRQLDAKISGERADMSILGGVSMKSQRGGKKMGSDREIS